jgi:glutamate racemase
MKIGLFDSGSGLFTVAQAIRRLNPKADLILYSDLANMPYGERSQEELISLMTADITALQNAGAEIIVSACNTLSVAVLQTAVPNVIEMVDPLAAELKADNIMTVTVVGTLATVGSGTYTKVLAEYGIHANAIALPGLAAAIEEEDVTQARVIIERHLTEQEVCGVGILACTHYPLVKELFAEIAPKTRWVDPADAVARAVIGVAGYEGNGFLEVITSAPPTSAYQRQYRLLS